MTALPITALFGTVRLGDSAENRVDLAPSSLQPVSFQTRKVGSTEIVTGDGWVITFTLAIRSLALAGTTDEGDPLHEADSFIDIKTHRLIDEALDLMPGSRAN